AQPAGQPDLVAAKTASPETIAVGGEVTFTLGVANHGSAEATGVVLRDPLPTGLAVVSLSAGCSGGPTLVCTVRGLAPGASRSFTIVVRAEPAAGGATLTNTVTAAADQTDPTPGNDSAQATVRVANVVDLSITVQRPATAAVGRTSIWRLHVVNHGP